MQLNEVDRLRRNEAGHGFAVDDKMEGANVNKVLQLPLTYMSPLAQKTRRKPWVPWVRFSIVLFLVISAGWLALELGQRFFGIQRLVVEQVAISGTQWDRLAEVQNIADELCKGKPMFLFDADQLQSKIEALRWVRAVLIRREPPDRISIVIEERQPLMMLVRPNGILLMSDDGMIMERVNQANIAPVPVVVDPTSQSEKNLIQLIRVARALKLQQPDFYSRLTEMRWSDNLPIVFMEGLQAPILLSKVDPAKYIPNFQAVYMEKYINKPVRYFDLRWDTGMVVGE